MAKNLLLLSAATVCLCTATSYANRIELENHYDQALEFAAVQNPDVFPDFRGIFKLNPSEKISSKVVKGDSGFINGYNDKGAWVFFSVKVNGDKNNIQAFKSQGAAYSWNAENTKIVFCTHEAYLKKYSCI